MSDDLPPELLAGYADGELPPDLRARVEAWLADNPEYLSQLEAQESLGPGNVEFWRSVRPPAPGQWPAVRLPTPKRGLGRWAGVVGFLAATAALIVVFVGNPPPCRIEGQHLHVCPLMGPDSDDEPYPVASAEEVRYLSLPESAAPLMVGGRHPLTETALVLARADEVKIHGMGSDVEGRFPEDPLISDPPVLWTPRELCPE